MLKGLLKLALFLVVGILVYNFFFGTPVEKEQSRQIFTEVKDLTKSAVQLMKTEKEKFDEGKYNEAVDEIGGLIDKLKGKAELLEDNKELMDQLTELQTKKKDLEHKIEGTPTDYGSEGTRVVDEREQKEIQKDWDQLFQETKELIYKMERKVE